MGVLQRHRCSRESRILRKDDGHVDAWAFSGSNGQVERIDFSSTGSETSVDRREYYLPRIPMR